MNFSFIGMASAGKSTSAKALAEKLEYTFFDVDRMVEEKYGKDLIPILKEIGRERFLKDEEDFIRKILESENVSIAPGGSIIYQPTAMDLLREKTKIVYLDTPLEIIKSRLAENPKAIVGLHEKTIDELYEERKPIYEHYADYTVEFANKTPEEIAKEISIKYFPESEHTQEWKFN